MRYIKYCAAVVLIATPAYADFVSDFQQCRNEPDSLKRLTCFDALKPVKTDATPEPAETPAAPAAIVLTGATLRIQQKDLDARVYNSRIEVLPTFKNNSKKTVVAIEHTLKITDAFGDAAVDGTSKLDITIPPGATVTSDTFYFFDDNPFIQDEPYDKLVGSFRTGVAKAAIVVTKAIFNDGSSESYKQ